MSIGNAARTHAAPTGHGSVHRIVSWLESKKGAFCVSRLIMQTGIKVRGFDSTSPDEPQILAKLWPAVESMLSAEERDLLYAAVRERH